VCSLLIGVHERLEGCLGAENGASGIRCTSLAVVPCAVERTRLCATRLKTNIQSIVSSARTSTCRYLVRVAFESDLQHSRCRVIPSKCGQCAELTDIVVCSSRSGNRRLGPMAVMRCIREHSIVFALSVLSTAPECRKVDLSDASSV